MSEIPEDSMDIETAMNIYEKARARGLDERTIERAQQDMRTGPGQVAAIHDAHLWVLLFSLAYDNPGKPVRLPWAGIGFVPHETSPPFVHQRAQFSHR